MPFHTRPALRRAAALLAACTAFATAPAWSAGAAQAGWQDEVGRFRIGLVARPGAGRGVEGLGRIEAAYARALGIEVEIFVARDYAALVKAHVAGRIHYAVYSAAAYAAASRLCACVEPLAAPTDPDGTEGIRAAVLARAGQEATLGRLRAGTVAAGPGGRLGAETLALTALEEGTRVRHAESAATAERLFAAGEADGLAGWMPWATGLRAPGGTRTRLAALGMADDEIAVVWRSQPIRHGPHAVRADLPEELKRRLRSWLLALKDAQPAIYRLIEKEHGGGFVPASASDYEAAGVLLDAAGRP